MYSRYFLALLLDTQVFLKNEERELREKLKGPERQRQVIRLDRQMNYE